jgi:hypothetical protein
MVVRLRERYAIARDVDNCKAVGLQVLSLLQSLDRLVFVAERHLPEGESEPSKDDAKRRIGFWVSAVTRGRGDLYAEARKLASAAVRRAGAVKHSPAPTRIEAGIAADAGILVVNLLRRLSELDGPDNQERVACPHVRP